jgi:hypothetical protein
MKGQKMSNSSNQTLIPLNTAEIVKNERRLKFGPLQRSSLTPTLISIPHSAGVSKITKISPIFHVSGDYKTFIRTIEISYVYLFDISFI